ncbi:MAG: hypothetical protein ACRERS_03985, partial [Methylococcales bacterium]
PQRWVKPPDVSPPITVSPKSSNAEFYGGDEYPVRQYDVGRRRAQSPGIPGVLLNQAFLFIRDAYAGLGAAASSHRQIGIPVFLTILFA